MNEIQSKLQELGLTGREAEVYLALLKKNGLSAPEVSKITTITRTKVYEILQNLVKKGLCNVTSKNKMNVFSSIEPTIAIRNILSIYENELNRKQKLGEQLHEELTELYEIKGKNTGPLDYIEVLNDVGQIRERFMSIQNNTKEQILVFTKPPYTNLTVEDTLETETNVIKNKVNARSIYEYQGLTKAELNQLIKAINKYEEIGEEARIIKELPMKMVISDETITMFALKDRVSLMPSLTTMIVDHPDFARAQKKVFETYWSEAIPIKDFEMDI